MAEGLTVYDLPWVEAWVCDQPPPGARYRVLREEWLKDGELRVIYEIQITGVESVDR